MSAKRVILCVLLSTALALNERGGWQYFMTNSTVDPVINSTTGLRNDGMDLIKTWKNNKTKKNLTNEYVYTRQQLNSVDPAKVDYLLGLFAPSHHTYEADRQPSSTEPTLTEMTEKAIKILSKNPKGYFLLIEGGRIDQGHHENGTKKALEELVEFDNSVSKVIELTSEDNTLLVVTADHSHVFSMAGYPSRGNNILGLVDIWEVDSAPADKMPYTTLGYLDGPYIGRLNLTGVATTVSSFKQRGLVEMRLETHGGEDVAIYAKGPMAHFFQGTREQSYIGHILMYSACIGVYKDNCDMTKRNSMIEPSHPCSAVNPMSSMMTCSALVVLTLQPLL